MGKYRLWYTTGSVNSFIIVFKKKIFVNRFFVLMNTILSIVPLLWTGSVNSSFVIKKKKSRCCKYYINLAAWVNSIAVLSNLHNALLPT